MSDISYVDEHSGSLSMLLVIMKNLSDGLSSSQIMDHHSVLFRSTFYKLLFRNSVCSKLFLFSVITESERVELKAGSQILQNVGDRRRRLGFSAMKSRQQSKFYCESQDK